jgi:hypothetical protein
VKSLRKKVQISIYVENWWSTGTKCYQFVSIDSNLKPSFEVISQNRETIDKNNILSNQIIWRETIDVVIETVIKYIIFVFDSFLVSLSYLNRRWIEWTTNQEVNEFIYYNKTEMDVWTFFRRDFTEQRVYQQKYILNSFILVSQKMNWMMSTKKKVNEYIKQNSPIVSHKEN